MSPSGHDECQFGGSAGTSPEANYEYGVLLRTRARSSTLLPLPKHVTIAIRLVTCLTSALSKHLFN